MTAQDYIISELERLQKPLGLVALIDSEQLESEIFRLITSKKFRKYSLPENHIDHIKQAIHLAVGKNEPIKLVFPKGAYKLWRLDEAPDADFAELFAMMYYTDWLKPVCEIYKPGVWFDFYAADLILTRMNNLTHEEIEEYCKSEQQVLDFLKLYQPSNMKMTVTRNSSLFKSEDDFWTAFEGVFKNIALPILDEKTMASVELNVRPTDEQLTDSLWREKSQQLHIAYLTQIRAMGYHANNSEKIGVFTVQVPIAGYIAVGSSKNSIMRHWIGVGVLKPRYDSYEMTILSGGQLAKTKFRFESVKFDGLDGKNFSKIRVLE